MSKSVRCPTCDAWLDTCRCSHCGGTGEVSESVDYLYLSYFVRHECGDCWDGYTYTCPNRCAVDFGEAGPVEDEEEEAEEVAA